MNTMQYQTEENGIIHCIMEGDLSLNNITDVREFLLSRLHEGTGLRISHAPDVQVDLAYMQLIIALKKSAGNSGKTCSIAAGAEDKLYKLFLTAGMSGKDMLHKSYKNNAGANNG